MKINLGLTLMLLAFGQLSYAGKIVHGVFCTSEINENQFAASVELNTKLNGAAPLELIGIGSRRCFDCDTMSTPAVVPIKRIDTSKIMQISSLVFFKEKRLDTTKSAQVEIDSVGACVTVSGEIALKQ